MSIDLEKSIRDAGFDPRTYVTTPRWIGSVIFKAGDLRQEGFQVGFEPISDNPHHGEVWGTFSKPKQRILSRICQWFVEIENVSKEID